MVNQCPIESHWLTVDLANKLLIALLIILLEEPPHLLFAE